MIKGKENEPITIQFPDETVWLDEIKGEVFHYLVNKAYSWRRGNGNKKNKLLYEKMYEFCSINQQDPLRKNTQVEVHFGKDVKVIEETLIKHGYTVIKPILKKNTIKSNPRGKISTDNKVISILFPDNTVFVINTVQSLDYFCHTKKHEWLKRKTPSHEFLYKKFDKFCDRNKSKTIEIETKVTDHGDVYNTDVERKFEDEGFEILRQKKIPSPAITMKTLPNLRDMPTFKEVKKESDKKKDRKKRTERYISSTTPKEKYAREGFFSMAPDEVRKALNKADASTILNKTPAPLKEKKSVVFWAVVTLCVLQAAEVLLIAIMG